MRSTVGVRGKILTSEEPVAVFPMASVKVGWCLVALLMYLKLNLWTNIYRPTGFWLYFQSSWAFLVTMDVRGSCRWLSTSWSGGFYLQSCILGLPRVLPTLGDLKSVKLDWLLVLQLRSDPLTHQSHSLCWGAIRPLPCCVQLAVSWRELTCKAG